MYCFSCLLPWIYTSSSSMDHRISSLLILASCMNACSSLWCYIISSLHLGEFALTSASLFPSAKCYKSFSNFFLSLLLLSLFRVDHDFGLSCNSFHMICLMYFIHSCVLYDLYNDNNPYLVVLP